MSSGHSTADGLREPISIDDNGGSLTVDDGGASITVDGPLTDAQLRAAPVPVSGTVTVTDGSGPLTVDGTVTAAEAKPEDSPAANADSGIPVLGVRNDTGATTTSADGDYTWLATDAAGRVGIADLGGSVSIDDNGGSVTVDGSVSLAAATTGGESIYRNINLGTAGANIKASAGQVYGWYFYNKANAARYVKFYNKASAPVVGTDVPVMTIGLPPGAGANVEFANGITFAVGIGIGATTGVADADTGAPAANDVVANVMYK